MLQIIARVVLLIFFIYLFISSVGIMFGLGMLLLAVLMGLAAPRK